MGVSVGVLISTWVKVGVFKTVGEAVFIGVKGSSGEWDHLPKTLLTVRKIKATIASNPTIANNNVFGFMAIFLSTQERTI